MAVSVRNGAKGGVVRTWAIFEFGEISKEESVVFTFVELRDPDRSAEGEPKLILLERSLRLPQGIGYVVGCVESAILKVFEQAAMKVVRAGAECKGDGSACKTVLGTLVIIGDLEFPYGINRGMILADVPNQISVQNRYAVNVYLSRVAGRPADMKPVIGSRTRH